MKFLRAQYKDDSTARAILRYGAFVAPISMMLYGLMVQVGALPVVHQSLEPNANTIIVLSLSWLMLGTMTFLTQQSRYLVVSALEIGAYFVLAMVQTWFINGLASPFAAYWVLLLIAAYVLLGKVGLRVGIMLFMATLVIDTLAVGHGEPTWAILSVLTAIAVLVTSLVIVTVYASQSTSHKDLLASHAREETERDSVVTLINNITDAVFSTNQHGIVKIYNSAALNLLDTNEKIEGRYISELMHLESASGKTIDVFEELSKNSAIRQRDDVILRLEGNDQLRLEATFAPVQSSGNNPGTADTYVLILRDITRIKSLEEERDEFISVVSHELRTPVTIAEGSLSNAEILAERGHQQKVTEAIEEAHKQVIFLAKMVNDLSTLSRAERGVSDAPELIDTTELANQLRSEYLDEAEAKNLKFDLDVIGNPGKVYVSRLYLQELLQNFITNAIKYTQKGSITLKIKRIDKKICFEVSDTGIGIGKADQQKIFERFYRAEDYRTRETNGTGLGLYVATKLSRKLGCKINVESRLNHGSTFGFMLPAKNQE